jgi:hypothetical protein
MSMDLRTHTPHSTIVPLRIVAPNYFYCQHCSDCCYCFCLTLTERVPLCAYLSLSCLRSLVQAEPKPWDEHTHSQYGRFEGACSEGEERSCLPQASWPLELYPQLYDTIISCRIGLELDSNSKTVKFSLISE